MFRHPSNRPMWGASIRVAGTGRRTRIELGPFWRQEVNSTRIPVQFEVEFAGPNLRQSGFGSSISIDLPSSPETYRGWETHCVLVLGQLDNRMMIWGMKGERVGEIQFGQMMGENIGGPTVLLAKGQFA